MLKSCWGKWTSLIEWTCTWNFFILQTFSGYFKVTVKKGPLWLMVWVAFSSLFYSNHGTCEHAFRAFFPGELSLSHLSNRKISICLALWVTVSMVTVVRCYQTNLIARQEHRFWKILENLKWCLYHHYAFYNIWTKLQFDKRLYILLMVIFRRLKHWVKVKERSWIMVNENKKCWLQVNDSRKTTVHCVKICTTHPMTTLRSHYIQHWLWMLALDVNLEV